MKRILQGKMFRSVRMVLLMCIVLSVGPQLYAGEEILPAILSGYQSIKDIKGTFSQKSVLKDLKKEMSFQGVFAIKIPKKMFWRYEGSDLQEVYINGDEMIVYQQKNSQAFRSKFDEATIGQTPIALLSGLKDVKKDYDVTEKDGFVRLTPKSAFFSINYIDIYPAEGKFPIKKIIVNDKNTNEIEITIEEVELNTEIKDSRFAFTPPEGTTIVEH